MGDECNGDVDTSKPTACNPLRNLKTFADEIRSLRDSPDKVLVAGIFGWPRSDSDAAAAEYKIAPVPNPNLADTLHPTVYDYWPVCYDPDHLPSAATADPATGFDATAAGWGATGGLREAAYVDQFGGNGMKFSICERDFSAPMSQIGTALAKKLQNVCLDYKLLDTDTATAGVQPECMVHWRIPVTDARGQVTYVENPINMPQCPAGAVSGEVAQDCWQLLSDKTKCSVTGQLVQVLRPAGEIANKPQLDPGTMLRMNCHICTPGNSTETGCAYSL
jgi:hypothetical protein